MNVETVRRIRTYRGDPGLSWDEGNENADESRNPGTVVRDPRVAEQEPEMQMGEGLKRKCKVLPSGKVKCAKLKYPRDKARTGGVKRSQKKEMTSEIRSYLKTLRSAERIREKKEAVSKVANPEKFPDARVTDSAVYSKDTKTRRNALIELGKKNYRNPNEDEFQKEMEKMEKSKFILPPKAAQHKAKKDMDDSAQEQRKENNVNHDIAYDEGFPYSLHIPNYPGNPGIDTQFFPQSTLDYRGLQVTENPQDYTPGRFSQIADTYSDSMNSKISALMNIRQITKTMNNVTISSFEKHSSLADKDNTPPQVSSELMQNAQVLSKLILERKNQMQAYNDAHTKAELLRESIASTTDVSASWGDKVVENERIIKEEQNLIRLYESQMHQTKNPKERKILVGKQTHTLQSMMKLIHENNILSHNMAKYNYEKSTMSKSMNEMKEKVNASQKDILNQSVTNLDLFGNTSEWISDGGVSDFNDILNRAGIITQVPLDTSGNTFHTDDSNEVDETDINPGLGTTAQSYTVAANTSPRDLLNDIVTPPITTDKDTSTIIGNTKPVTNEIILKKKNPPSASVSTTSSTTAISKQDPNVVPDEVKKRVDASLLSIQRIQKMLADRGIDISTSSIPPTLTSKDYSQLSKVMNAYTIQLESKIKEKSSSLKKGEKAEISAAVAEMKSDVKLLGESVDATVDPSNNSLWGNIYNMFKKGLSTILQAPIHIQNEPTIAEQVDSLKSRAVVKEDVLNMIAKLRKQGVPEKEIEKQYNEIMSTDGGKTFIVKSNALPGPTNVTTSLTHTDAENKGKPPEIKENPYLSSKNGVAYLDHVGMWTKEKLSSNYTASDVSHTTLKSTMGDIMEGIFLKSNTSDELFYSQKAVKHVVAYLKKYANEMDENQTYIIKYYPANDLVVLNVLKKEKTGHGLPSNDTAMDYINKEATDEGEYAGMRFGPSELDGKDYLRFMGVTAPVFYDEQAPDGVYYSKINYVQYYSASTDVVNGVLYEQFNYKFYNPDRVDILVRQLKSNASFNVTQSVDIRFNDKKNAFDFQLKRHHPRSTVQFGEGVGISHDPKLAKVMKTIMTLYKQNDTDGAIQTLHAHKHVLPRSDYQEIYKILYKT